MLIVVAGVICASCAVIWVLVCSQRAELSVPRVKVNDVLLIDAPVLTFPDRTFLEHVQFGLISVPTVFDAVRDRFNVFTMMLPALVAARPGNVAVSTFTSDCQALAELFDASDGFLDVASCERLQTFLASTPDDVEDVPELLMRWQPFVAFVDVWLEMLAVGTA